MRLRSTRRADPGRDAVAILLLALDRNTKAIAEIVSVYRRPEDFRRLLTFIAVVLDAVAMSEGEESRQRLRESLEAVGQRFETGPAAAEEKTT